MPSISAPSVFTPREIARAAGSTLSSVLAELGRAGADDILVPRADAVRLVRRLKRGLGAAAPPPLFCGAPPNRRKSGLPVAASALAHAGFFAVAIIAASLGADMKANPVTGSASRLEPLRMVYVAIPGPGGGGGGGGTRMAVPAPRARRQGTSKVSSPVPERRQAPVEPAAKPVEPPPAPLPAEPLPPILAPVVALPSDDRSRAGVIDAGPTEMESRGPGTGGGAGAGLGTGMGEGDGPGIGAGSGGGTGGGPYRPGSGVEPPAVLHEVKPTYTEAARVRGVTGEVVLEIVVLRNGSVGAIRVVHGLGSGLDERAVDAVRQWRFSPATRLGQPVDVMVEVGVEFRLR